MSTPGKKDRSGYCRPVFPFHYGGESESYAFYRVLKALFESEVFRPLSTDAKLLYGLLNDRMDLSRKNGWIDEEGKVYIYFTRQSVMEALDCGNKKAGQLFAELDDKNGIGLITRTRQGLGKPDRIYVHKCVVPGVQRGFLIQQSSRKTSRVYRLMLNSAWALKLIAFLFSPPFQQPLTFRFYMHLSVRGCFILHRAIPVTSVVGYARKKETRFIVGTIPR